MRATAIKVVQMELLQSILLVIYALIPAKHVRAQPSVVLRAFKLIQPRFSYRTAAACRLTAVSMAPTLILPASAANLARASAQPALPTMCAALALLATSWSS